MKETVAALLTIVFGISFLLGIAHYVHNNADGPIVRTGLSMEDDQNIARAIKAEFADLYQGIKVVRVTTFRSTIIVVDVDRGMFMNWYLDIPGLQTAIPFDHIPFFSPEWRPETLEDLKPRVLAEIKKNAGR